MKETPFVKQRQQLEAVFRAGLAAVHGSRSVADYLAGHPPENCTAVVAIGAIVDPATLARGAAAGLDPVQCLRQADSAHFLEACGDVLVTGPTGTNVTDMVIGLKMADEPGG